jgi:prophage regulatory protein
MAKAIQENLKILRLNQVIAKIGVSKSGLYVLIQQGLFPRPIELGPRSRGWIEYEIEAWIEQRISDRDSKREKEART